MKTSYSGTTHRITLTADLSDFSIDEKRALFSTLLRDKDVVTSNQLSRSEISETFYALDRLCNWNGQANEPRKQTVEKSRFEMLERNTKETLVEVRAEIRRLNEAAGRTVFNPAATQMVDALLRVVS